MRLYDNPIVWRENNNNWNDRDIKWKTIGNHLIKKTNNKLFISDKLRNLLLNFVPDNFIVTRAIYHIVEYKSGRLDICYDYIPYSDNLYVILEADRGEDCGKILGTTNEYKINTIFEKYKEVLNEIETKRILRYATDYDLEELKKREIDEKESLEKCKELVFSSKFIMEIISCEYQWDKKKITFYFKSSKRVDFRDLLKDLFKLFKIRIWLCAEKKSYNSILRGLLEK